MPTMTANQKETVRILAEIKMQISETFKEKKYRDKILHTLGYTPYFIPALRNNQSALFGLLSQFKENLTSDLRTEMEVKGIAKDSLDKVLEYAGNI